MPQRPRSHRSAVACRAALLLWVAMVSQACEQTLVTPVEVEVEVVPAQITLVEGDSGAVSAVLREASGEALDGGTVTWTVDDPGIASITQQGVVEASSPGTTLIRASIGDVSGTAALRVVRLERDPGPACEIGSNSISGDLRIPPGAMCVLSDLTVTGHLVLGAGSSVTGSDVEVHGDVEAKHAADLTLTDALILGHFRFEEGGSVALLRSRVRGKVELKGNLGAIELQDDVIEDDAKLEKNRYGPFRLVGNTVDGKLECKDNDPPPSGSGNVAEQLSGQCRAF